MRLKYLTILVFFIVQTSIDASGNENYPECLETSEGCASTTDSPTPGSPADSSRQDYCQIAASVLFFNHVQPFLPVCCLIILTWRLIWFHHLTGLIISIIANHQFVMSFYCTATQWPILPGHIFFLTLLAPRYFVCRPDCMKTQKRLKI